MTEKLYYKDPYLKEFDSIVAEVRKTEQGCWCRLRETAFYPEGGGQPWDEGSLLPENKEKVSVLEVQEEQDGIWHKLSSEIELGMQVHGVIDWERRFDHMQQHSGEHIVSGMICSRFQCDNVGFHMGEDTVTIDYNAPISFEQVLQIETEANHYIWENHAFEELWPNLEELKKIDYRSKKELSGAVRITRFPGADTCACCGTHVASSSEVGLVKFISAKNFHEGTRLELYCGKRAMDYLSMNFMSNKAVAVLLSTKEEKCPELVKKLIEEKTSLKSELSAMENRYLTLRAESVKGQTDVLMIDDCLSPDQGRVLADKIAENCTGKIVVMVGKDENYRYSVICRNQDISLFVKEMNAALQGRGGGRDGFAQGSVNASKEQIEAFFKDKK